MSETLIKVEHVRKTYRDYRSNFQKLRHMVILSSAGEKNRILQDISFEIKKGEKVAIFGPPSSGKSTIMRIVAGIIKPESGTVEVKGTPKLIFDHRMGFELSLSGRDNYEMRARIEGWSKEKIKEREERVFKFAALTDLIDVPLRSYPKGGPTRLGYAISTDDDPEFLLFDERMAFGNVRINRKFLSRFKRVTGNPDMTLLMTANEPNIAVHLCERGIVIMEGKVVFDGPCAEARKYLKEQSGGKRKKKKEDVESDGEDQEALDLEPEDDDMDEMQ